MAQVPDLSGNFPPSLPSGVDPNLVTNFNEALSRAAPVTPNDDTPVNAMALYIGGTGNVVVRPRSNPNEIVTFPSVPANTRIDLEIVRVMAATTATNILALN